MRFLLLSILTVTLISLQTVPSFSKTREEIQKCVAQKIAAATERQNFDSGEVKVSCKPAELQTKVKLSITNPKLTDCSPDTASQVITYNAPQGWKIVDAHRVEVGSTQGGKVSDVTTSPDAQGNKVVATLVVSCESPTSQTCVGGPGAWATGKITGVIEKLHNDDNITEWTIDCAQE